MTSKYQKYNKVKYTHIDIPKETHKRISDIVNKGKFKSIIAFINYCVDEYEKVK